MTETHILVVEDEPAIAKLIEDYASQAGMRTTILHSGRRAVETVLSLKPDLVVLDIMLPDVDGISICIQLRSESNIPIIMQTAKAEEIDRLLGLEIGADDYLCKPYSPRELIARIKTVLRRTQPQQDGTGRNQVAFVVNTFAWTVYHGGRELQLTRREFQVFEVMFAQPGRVFSRSQLLDLAFQGETDIIDRTIDSHIKNIRAKIRRASGNPELIRSVYGVGYAFDDG